jgi:hypothetical protein
LFFHLQVHALDIANKALYAAGAFSQGGFEKITELNPQSKDHVIFAVAGYNGENNPPDAAVNARNAFYGPRPDGTPYVPTQYIVPFRIYVGVKGLLEDGSSAPEDDFLARNGLKYGQIYGFAIDMDAAGPTGGMWRDDWHRSEAANNGAMIPGAWIAQQWRWNGTVMNFQHDGSWDWQIPIPNPPTGMETYAWWNPLGNDEAGCKCEHVTPVCTTC